MRNILLILLFFSSFLKSQSFSYQNCDSVDRIQKFYVDYNSGSTYNWSVSDGYILSQINNKVTVIFPDSNSVYVLSVVEYNSSGCPGYEKKVLIESKPCEIIWIPNTFTPDDDNLNDIFKIYGKVDEKDFVLEVYNKWGEMIFKSNNPEYGWDGRFNNKIAQDDVYVYKVICRVNKKYFIKYGTVTLLK
jgi:gliding motility-associated-like protein